MSAIRLSVPTLYDEPQHFDTLFRLAHQCDGDHLHVTFDFTGCTFLKHNAVAFLGGLIRSVQKRSGKVSLDLSTMDRKVEQNLHRNHFLGTFLGRWGYRQNAIPFREHTSLDEKAIYTYLDSDWLGRRGINELVKKSIVATMAEIYVNAFEHGLSPVGVASCGQFYPVRRELSLCVVDFGRGIPSTVRSLAENKQMSAAHTIRWAFLTGTSSKRGQSRGLGLALLRDFITANGGMLEVYSHDGYARLGPYDEYYASWASHFDGTLVNITLRSDGFTVLGLAPKDLSAPLFG